MDTKERSPLFIPVKNFKPSTDKKNTPISIMDTKERSPLFLPTKNVKPSADKKNTPASQKNMYKAQPSIQLLQSLNMYQPPADQSSTVKKLNLKPVRTCELDLTEFMKSPEVKTKNVRKQLWSVKKEDNKATLQKRGTFMKPSVRKTVNIRPSLLQFKKNTTKTQKMDDTLPLLDMEQFTVSKISRNLFTASHKTNVPQRKTISQLNLNKKQIVSSLAKKTLPSVVITPAERSVKKPSTRTTSNNKPKEKKDETIDVVFQKLSIIEQELKSFNEIKPLILLLCNHLGIEVPKEKKSPNRKEKTKKSPCPKPDPIETNNAKNELKQICSETSEKPHNTTPCTSDRTIETDTKTNENDDKQEPILNKELTNNMEAAEVTVKIALKPENTCTPKIDHTTNKTESTIKLKKTWISQFEQLENKLLNNSNMSINLNSSPDDSPVPALHLNETVNSCDTNPISLKKSQSTSNLVDGNGSQLKNILFKSRETADLLTESICVYNELRDELPKFLSTPVTKTNRTMSLITPSVQGNEKKLISRRVQEQLLRLNNCL